MRRDIRDTSITGRPYPQLCFDQARAVGLSAGYEHFSRPETSILQKRPEGGDVHAPANMRYHLSFACVFFLLAWGALSVSTFTNPIKPTNGSDPFMVYQEGYYYLTTTTWSNIQLTRATTIAGLKTATPKTIWTDSTASRCCNMWAPEIHWKGAEGAWYIYYAAGTSGDIGNQHTHALKGSSTDIWASTWSHAAQITLDGIWAIDSTVLLYGGNEYMVYSRWSGNYQCLWIAQMTSATTTGASTIISCPSEPWEEIGENTNEGPAPLYHDGNTFIIYSASSCAASGYSLGQLQLTGTNPLLQRSWTKYTPGPIFSAANGEYAPGHNGFFLSPSGNQIWLVYHASPATVTCDGNRKTMIQGPITWHTNGAPNLGTPRAISDSIPEPV